MKKRNIIFKSFALVMMFTLVIPMTYASLSALSFTGNADDKSKSNKFSLKYYNSSNKSFSLSNYKNNLQYKGLLNLNVGNSKSSVLQFSSGNDNYIIPFKYSVKVSKFKMPSANNL